VLLVGGLVANGLAGALYIGSQFGAGPRDGLMTGLVHRTGGSIRLVRTSLEVTVLALGWLLGGTVGLGTVLYALSIGPLVQLFLGWVIVELPERSGDALEDDQRRVASTTEESSVTMTSTDVKRSSLSHCSRNESTRPS
jgi:uncharacterized membrane protein YczE